MESLKDSDPIKSSEEWQTGGAGFPRSARLLKPADFKRVFKRNFVSADRYFKVLGSMNDGDRSRLGMAVSRQVDKRAVGRNRIKRVIREHFRKSFPGSKEASAGRISAGIDLVVLPRRECATTCNHQLSASFAAHCLRIVRALESRKSATDQQTLRPGSRRANQEAGTT